MRIAILDGYQSVALEMADWSALGAKADIAVFHDTLSDENALAERLAPFEVLCLMRERTPLTASLIARLPNLRHVFTSGMRNKSIDLAACRARGVVVTGEPTLDTPTVELTFGLLLALARQIPRENAGMHAGGWAQTIGTDLSGNTLGILGLGRMGRQVATIAKAFGMNVLAWSSNLTVDACLAADVEFAGSKQALLQRSDFVTIHLMLGDRSRGTIGAAEFSQMKPTAYLINTSRAEIIDQTALLEALALRRIAGAAVDVYEREPLAPGHPIRSLDNVLLTPHQGYVTERNYRNFYAGAVRNILAWLDGNTINQLDETTGPKARVEA